MIAPHFGHSQPSGVGGGSGCGLTVLHVGQDVMPWNPCHGQ